MIGDAYGLLTDYHKALDQFQSLLKAKQRRLKTNENSEITNVMFLIALQMGNIGHYEESLKIYQEVYGKEICFEGRL